MKYYLIAGEASGDLHASNLIKALNQEDSAAQFRCWGGDLMQQAGGELVKHYRDLAFMGIWEVVKNLKTIRQNFAFCEKDISDYQPDVLILIDYSGFNLRIAKWAKTAGFKVFYYISPQVWASRQSRVKKIKKYVDRMFVILPFEKDFYQQFGMEVDYVGHPLLDAIRNFKSNALCSNKDGKSIIALLPGSRKQEIKAVLKIMLTTVKAFPAYQFVIAAAPAIPTSFYQKIIQAAKLSNHHISLVHNQTYPLLHKAKAAIVTSGTATLETALFEVPQVVCYKGNWLTYQIVKRIIKVPYISLVNLIANRPLVKELIQNELTAAALEKELSLILKVEKALVLKAAYRQIKEKLGNAGASQKAAKLMVQYLQQGIAQ
ncbi:MAG: lipid-A-disaccharide synthase [Saprospiraceae bacterium]